MTGNGVPPEPPEPSTVVRRLETARSSSLVDLAETFEDLQMVLRCCERLVAELSTGDGKPDDVLVEAVWTMALLSYARCFSAGEGRVALTEEDLTATLPSGDVLEWHTLLLRLRDHHSDPVANPRERFSVGVTQDASGAASGVAVTSARQPLVDDLTVRQTGAIAYALSGLVNDRIDARQKEIFEELKSTPTADLENLVPLDIAEPTAGS